MVFRIETPQHAGARDQARDLAQSLATDLSEDEVVLDCGSLLVGTPSFLDEILKQILVERAATSLAVEGASTRVQELLGRSAANRGVGDRLVFPVRS
jgi:hypothetical protein